MRERIRRFLERCEAEYDEQQTPWRVQGFPECPSCHARKRDYTIVRSFVYSVDRLSRGRVKGILRCNNCQMQAVIMRWGDGGRWSWYESN